MGSRVDGLGDEKQECPSRSPASEFWEWADRGVGGGWPKVTALAQIDTLLYHSTRLGQQGALSLHF